MANFKPVFDLTLKHEGGFQKFPNDSANIINGVVIGTNRGISAQAYKQYFKKTPTENDMRALTEEQAAAIFKANYWNKINGDKIKNQSIAELMFQYIIGSGASQLSDLKDIANMVAGKKVLASTDTPFTDAEAEIINNLPQKKYWDALKEWRHAFFLRIVNNSIEKLTRQLGRTPTEKELNDKTLKRFLKGWQSRLNSYVYVDSNGSFQN